MFGQGQIIPLLVRDAEWGVPQHGLRWRAHSLVSLQIQTGAALPVFALKMPSNVKIYTGHPLASRRTLRRQMIKTRSKEQPLPPLNIFLPPRAPLSLVKILPFQAKNL